MNEYLTAIDGMSKILTSTKEPLKHFQKKEYALAFQQFYQEHMPAMDAIESLYNSVNDPDQMLTNMAEALAENAQEQIQACKRRSDGERLTLDFNLVMVVYVLPMVLEFGGNCSKPLVDKILSAWKEKFPKSNIQAASFETIEKGFHKKFCYITTAVCQSFGKADSCYELNLLRDYRDNYLAALPEGEALIDEYYDVAPSIVKHIGQQPDSEKIYRSIWDEYLAPCISMIESNQLEDCKEHYMEMVHTLRERYFLH